MNGRTDDVAKQMTALVKGAGPSGLAAAVTLAQEGFKVTVAEKRPFRPFGQGRKNMVAIRPEALHQLDLLGALGDAQSKGTLTPLTEAFTYNEWDDSNFVWPLAAQSRYEKVHDVYEPPGKINDQFPSSFVNLGHLEDHLSEAARQIGVEIQYSSTFDLRLSDDGSGRYCAVRSHLDSRGADASNEMSTSAYDLIVCASGKGDDSLERSLGFKRLVGLKLEEDNLPKEGSRQLRPGPECEIETQRYLVFGISSTSEAGKLEHFTRKSNTGNPEQPVVEIEMRHAAARHFILQLPRGFYETTHALDAYATQRVNMIMGASFANVLEMKQRGVIVWGDPLNPVGVETSTAPTYVFGSNVILVGDAGMRCSPTSGLGSDIGMVHDGQAVRQMAKELMNAHTLYRQQNENNISCPLHLTEHWQKALDKFNLEKARGAVIWSQGSRNFYVEKTKADEILASVKELEASA